MSKVRSLYPNRLKQYPTVVVPVFGRPIPTTLRRLAGLSSVQLRTILFFNFLAIMLGDKDIRELSYSVLCIFLFEVWSALSCQQIERIYKAKECTADRLESELVRGRRGTSALSK